MALYKNIEDIFKLLTKEQTLMGIDLGTKTIGLAISDTTLKIASPFETIRRKKFHLDADQLDDIITLKNVGAIIFGLPLNMNGTSGPRVQSTHAFIRHYLARKTIPIALWDERLSTVAMDKTLIKANMTRAKRDKVIDKMAAAFILQGVLNYLYLKQHTT